MVLGKERGSRIKDKRLAVRVVKEAGRGGMGVVDLSSGELEFILPQSGSIEPPKAGLRRTVMGSALALFCRTVMR